MADKSIINDKFFVRPVKKTVYKGQLTRPHRCALVAGSRKSTPAHALANQIEPEKRRMSGPSMETDPYT